MLIPPKYTPVQITVPDDEKCSTILHIWQNVYSINQDSYSYVSHVSLVRTYNLIYTLIKTDKLKLLKYPYTVIPISSAENIEFYKLNYFSELTLKKENDILETINYAGSQFWYKNGKLHRDNNLAAIILPDGSQSWYQNGVRC